MFIDHLSDKSNEVKSNAVQCIRQISAKIREKNLLVIMETLCKNICSEELNTVDIFSLTVKMIIREAKADQAEGMIDKLYPILLVGLSTATEEKRQKELLDTWSELLQKFGLVILRSTNSKIDKETLMNSIFKHLI